MGFKVADRVKETITAAGSGDITLAGSAASGFQSFASGISNGDYTFYVIEENGKWEVGYGQFIDDKLTRDKIFDSSEGGSRIDLAGETSVTITYPAERSVYLDESLNTVAGSGLKFTNDEAVLDTNNGFLYWDDNKLAYDEDLVYVSGLAVNAEETLEIEYVSGVAIYASGEVDKFSNYSNVTSSVNVEIQDNLLFIDSSSSDINVYMPLATGNGGKQLKIKWIEGTNTVNILPSGSETIDGQSSLSMHHLYESITLSSNNTNWFIT